MHRVAWASVCVGAFACAAWGQGWGLVGVHTASDGEASDEFGSSVAIEGDIAAFGSQVGRGSKSGEVYVFERAAGVWTQTARLTPSHGDAGDKFGASVAVRGQQIFVGAPNDDDRASNSGAVYVFTKSSGVWQESQKLSDPGGAQSDFFGTSISFDGSLGCVGVPLDDEHGSDSGSVFVFEGVRGTWDADAKLIPSDAVTGQDFGRSVSVSGSVVLAGAALDDDNGLNAGAAYVFSRFEGFWIQSAKLLASDGHTIDRFGCAADLDGTTAVVGAYGDDSAGAEAGSAYVFELAGGQWTQTAKLLPSEGAQAHYFGIAVAISGGTIVVGSGNDAAHVFEKRYGVWTRVGRLADSDVPLEDAFGASVDTDGETAFVGAPVSGEPGERIGAVYEFGASACVADFNDDGEVDTRDVLAFLNAYSKHEQSADIDGNGVVDTRDVLAFLNLWGAGC